MLSILFRQGTVYTVSYVLARGINFLALPIYARVFAPGQFGVYELLTVFSAFAGLLVALEITQGLARFYPEAPPGRERAEYASSSLWFAVLAYSIFCSSAAALASPIAALLLGSGDYAPVLRIALLAIWTNGLCHALQDPLRWRLHARYYSISSLVLTIVSQAVALAYIFLVGARIEGIFWGLCAGGLAGASLAAYYGRESLVLRPSRAKLAAMLRFSAPLALSGLAVLASRYADRIALKELLDVDAVGIYGVAARFAALATFMLAGFQGALVPLITTFHREPRAPDDMARVLRYFLALAMPLTLLVTVYSHDIVVVLAGEPYEAGHVLVPWLAIGALLSGMYIFMPGLWLAKDTGLTLAINASSALLTIVLTLLLIPGFGLVGAALATVGGAAANFGTVFALSQRRYRLPVEGMRLASASALFILLLVALQAFGQRFEPSELARAATALAAMFCIAVILVPPAEMRRLGAGAMREFRLR